MPLNIAIFEDHENLRSSLQMFIAGFTTYQVTGSYGDATNIIAKLKLSQPDVVLMDIDMPGISGIDAVKEVRQLLPECVIIMQTIHDDEQKIFDSLKAGAHGYLTKDTKPVELMQAIDEAVAGGSPMTPGIARKVTAHFKQQPLNDNDFNLSEREKEILQQLGNGKSYKMIASDLFIAYETVHSHIRRIYQKLHVSSLAEALGVAFRKNIIR
jgi:DNA-binding NarL/FixJ family response regulator